MNSLITTQSAMTMTLPAAPPASTDTSMMPVLRVIVALVGLAETFSGLADVPVLFGDTSKIDGLRMMVIALHPAAGIVAFACALADRLRYGIAAIGVLALAQWVSDLPSTIRDGFTLSADIFANGHAIIATFGRPIIGAGALAAAWSNRHLTAATIAIMLPTIVAAAGIAAFAIGVFLYGF
jgi:hypothetical protein